MKSYIKIIVFVAAASINSCSDYVDEINPNEISAESYFKDLEESNTVLTAVYGAMLNSWITSPKEEAWRSDLAFPGVREGQQSANALNYYHHIVPENDNSLNLRYRAMYQVIWRANQVIDGLNSMEDENLKSQAEWTEQMAQARFFRGLMHFYIHATFNNGEIVIRDAIPGSTEEFSKPLSSSQEVIDFFRADLLYAYEYLPDTFSEKTRPSAGAAATILGTSYLYTASEGNTADYQTAKTYFEDVINGPYGYALVQDASIMFTAEGDFNSESILEINYAIEQQPEDGNWDEESFFTRNARYAAPIEGGGGNVSEQFTAAAWLVHAYATEPLNQSDLRNVVTDRGTNAIRFRKVSLRASAMIAMVNDEDTEYYLQPSAPNLVNFNNGKKYGYFKKYTNHDIIDNENNLGDNNWKSGKNIILHRLADVHLMYAEALLMGDGDISGAIAQINLVRNRWALQLLDENADLINGDPYTQQSLMEHLMYVERPLELAVEGVSIRIIDLRRWGVAEARYQDLATRDYYVTDYDYYNDEAGTTQTRTNSLVREGISPDADTDPQIIREYVNAASFYTDGYLPLPTSETLNNNTVSN